MLKGVQPTLSIPTTAHITAEGSSLKGMWLLSKEALFKAWWEAYTVVPSKQVVQRDKNLAP